MKWHLNKPLNDQEVDTAARAFSAFSRGNHVDKFTSVAIHSAH